MFGLPPEWADRDLMSLAVLTGRDPSPAFLIVLLVHIISIRNLKQG